MAHKKTKDEIQKMAKGGALLSSALQAAIDAVDIGVRLSDLDKIAEGVIRDGGGTPSFLGYKGGGDLPFPSTVCASVNEEVVHGSCARDRKLELGDLVGLDIGCWYEGLCTDMAVTVPVGGFERLSNRDKELLTTTRASLMSGIEAAAVGKSISDISRAIEEVIKPHKFGVVRALVGHGVGHEVHEDPHVPNYVDPSFADVEIVDGMCLAIEPMLTLGTWEVETADDGWSIVTKDGSLGAHFELTIAITSDGVQILTPPPTVGF